MKEKEEKEDKGNKYGNLSVGSAIGALFISPPIFMVIGIIFGGLAIDNDSPRRGIVGIILSILFAIGGWKLTVLLYNIW